ncbi:hypothetical protein IG197_10290 [Aminobacter sp. SR38]|jgi:hypothetical protein|uniref:hypothetical protein n=1 Tax=Aminobacter sp. SR38 TaxID=2774562 RepID=UPI00177D8249|nr:hypothetical protein [Aminobacter sp. SR38]QOF73402.1 hypothetical protein IG197_10290 [Aminobacter sp. SR38]
MIMLLIVAIVLLGAMVLLAYRLATFALPFMLALKAARFAYATGAGWIGAGIVGLFAGVATFGILAYLFATLRAPVLRIAVAIVFAAPAAVAGYALVHGVTSEAVPSEIWRQIFCIAGGIFVGCSALARLADPSIFDQDR